ncbi:phosphoribosylanthranilate isomerase [Campylobacter cuniculorum]|uniref:N-(5'-phosphoribosyl)anthranilate isomerase n=2 Tax=Campylobacter cuniculorum TaxID=374106 RepID=A0A1W6BYR9_9BACT|nr:phosphoribosylanthranilate isomerase [Campylobacter cuniculorum]ARJ57212.1 phosphoribosylanthranilate isomerase [Campylobacter cuniculorum DSM 23162 = LMG 24588]QOR04653.1 phosphoribosylanthranilate isomerase [Campylobacter cuniculorum]
MKLKICGIKDEQNAKQLSALEVDFLGLIFSKSPRQVDLKKAKRLCEIIHQNSKKAIGVFVDESLDFILKAVETAKLDGVQIYDLISKSMFELFKEKKLFVLQVIRVGERLELPNAIYADMILFDTKGQFKGGNGVRFDWTLLKNFKKDFAIAGGIGLENIQELKKLQPKIVDVNSKFENAEGLKDVEKIKQFIRELKK